MEHSTLIHHLQTWGTANLAIFCLANVLTFGAYLSLALLHLRSNGNGTRTFHYLYAGFIGTCGIGHLAMVIHMVVIHSPLLMMVTHLATAVVSLATVFESTRVRK